jgi:hypothetical protein
MLTSMRRADRSFLVLLIDYHGMVLLPVTPLSSGEAYQPIPCS